MEWLTLACETLSEEGVGAKDLRAVVYDTPARLIGIVD